MFTDSRSIDDRATAASFDTAYQKYAAAGDSWFDGTPLSIDNRLAQCNRLMHIARTRVARRGADSGPLTNLAHLETDKRALVALRHDLLSGAYDREDNSPIAGVHIAENTCENCGKSWKKCTCDGARSSDAYDDDPEDEEWLRKNNPDGPKEWDRKANCGYASREGSRHTAGHLADNEVPGVPAHNDNQQPQEFWEAYSKHREDGYHPATAYARAFDEHGVAEPKEHVSSKRTALNPTERITINFLHASPEELSAAERKKNRLENAGYSLVSQSGNEMVYKLSPKDPGGIPGTNSRTASDSVNVREIPECDICKYEEHKEGVPAAYDGKTVHGPWGYMCEKHFGTHGVGLGTGKGQRLVKEARGVSCPQCGKRLNDEIARAGHAHGPDGEVYDADPQYGFESLGDYQSRQRHGEQPNDHLFDEMGRYHRDRFKGKESSLSPQDRRFVTLESSKFLAENTDTNDARELATRAMHHAQKVTSTLDVNRSSTITSAFVERVASGAQQRRREAPQPTATKTANINSLPPEAMFL